MDEFDDECTVMGVANKEGETDGHHGKSATSKLVQAKGKAKAKSRAKAKAVCEDPSKEPWFVYLIEEVESADCAADVTRAKGRMKRAQRELSHKDKKGTKRALVS